jgi:hypothetical protein
MKPLSRKQQADAFRQRMLETDYKGHAEWSLMLDEITLELIESDMVQYDPERDAVRWIGTDEDFARLIGKEVKPE